MKRIPVADKGGMIYVVQQPGFLDPGAYQVLLFRGLGQPPIKAGESSDEPDVVLVEDGQSFGVLTKGKSISTTDIRTGKVTRFRP